MAQGVRDENSSTAILSRLRRVAASEGIGRLRRGMEILIYKWSKASSVGKCNSVDAKSIANNAFSSKHCAGLTKMIKTLIPLPYILVCYLQPMLKQGIIEYIH